MGEVHLTDDPIPLEGLPAALDRFTESVNTFYDETKRREAKWKVLVVINTIVMVAVTAAAAALVVAVVILVPLQRDNHRILGLVEGAVGPEAIQTQQQNQARQIDALVDQIAQRTTDEIERRLATKP